MRDPELAARAQRAGEYVSLALPVRRYLSAAAVSHRIRPGTSQAGPRVSFPAR